MEFDDGPVGNTNLHDVVPLQVKQGNVATDHESLSSELSSDSSSDHDSDVEQMILNSRQRQRQSAHKALERPKTRTTALPSLPSKPPSKAPKQTRKRSRPNFTSDSETDLDGSSWSSAIDVDEFYSHWNPDGDKEFVRQFICFLLSNLLHLSLRTYKSN